MNKIKIFLPVFLLVVVGMLALSSCEKEANDSSSPDVFPIVEKSYITDVDKEREVSFFSNFKIDTALIKEEVFIALNYFKNASCENTTELSKSMEDYFKYRKIDEFNSCSFSETNPFLSLTDVKKQLDYLKDNNYVSGEIISLLDQYFTDIENAEDENLEYILNNYISQVESSVSIPDYEKNRLLLGFYISQNTLKYFDANLPKGLGDCKDCIWSNRKSILAGTGVLSVIGSIACVGIFWSAPAYIPVCIAANASIWVYVGICRFCTNECFFC